MQHTNPSPEHQALMQRQAIIIPFFYAFGLVFGLYGIGIYVGMPDILSILSHPITSVAIAHDNGQRLAIFGIVVAIIGGINHLLYGAPHNRGPHNKKP